MSNKTTGLDIERGYELTAHYVKVFWNTNKFYSLKRDFELDDMINEVMCKFLEKKYFEKFNPEVTSDKYFVMNGVRTRFIDALRVQKKKYYLDQEDENGVTLAEKIDSGYDLESDVLADQAVKEILNSLPDTTNSKVVGHSPLGTFPMSMRAVAQHMMAGYKLKEIATFFINPNNGKPVSTGSISQIVKKVREELTLCGYSA